MKNFLFQTTDFLSSSNLSSKSSTIRFNSKVKNDTLLICLSDSFTINISDDITKKNVQIRCIPNTGIVITKNTSCGLNIDKYSKLLEIVIEDKVSDIENSNKSTI